MKPMNSPRAADGCGGVRRQLAAAPALARDAWAQTFPQYAVSGWIGRSITVSGRHDANRIPDELSVKVFTDKVANGEAAQNAAQSAAESVVREQTSAAPAEPGVLRISIPVNGMRSESKEPENKAKWSRGELNPRAVTV